MLRYISRNKQGSRGAYEELKHGMMVYHSIFKYFMLKCATGISEGTVVMCQWAAELHSVTPCLSAMTPIDKAEWRDEHAAPYFFICVSLDF